MDRVGQIQGIISHEIQIKLWLNKMNFTRFDTYSCTCVRSTKAPNFSEGIGRTGVVALLEGALNLIESKCGVYPLDMVTALRDQRPKLIQNYPLFKFACESILYLYSKFWFIVNFFGIILKLLSHFS